MNMIMGSLESENDNGKTDLGLLVVGVEIKKLIEDKHSGDSGWMPDALNEMYLMMVSNQSMLNSYMANSDKQIAGLNARVDTIDEKMAKIDQKLYKQMEATNHLFQEVSLTLLRDT